MIGTFISHYKILEKLGEGGMGVVYKARDTKLDRDVALKFLSPHLTADDQAIARFEREARAASSLDHPNISVIYEIGETKDGRSFLCMGYYEGETLKERIERKPIELHSAISIAVQIARGLQRAHNAGIIHRDIKPENIILTNSGEVKIVDFGLAKLTSESRITKTGKGGGTLAYMSPEQLQGEKVDYRTDLYSLGVLMYEMLTGKRPYIEEHYAALMYSIVNTEPPPPSVINPEIPVELDEIVTCLISKNPSKRIQSAGDVIQQLEQYSTNRISDKKAITGIIKEKIKQPNYVIAALLVILVISAISLPMIRNTIPFLNSATTPEDFHLVVLPFKNVGDDPQNKAFADGLMETLVSSLTRFQPSDVSYWVVSASEVRERNVTSARDALREFNATIAVYGSVQRLSDQVRLTLNLVDTKTSHQIRSELITMQRQSLAGLQNEAVSTLVRMLDLQTNEIPLFNLASGGTSDPDSYEYYLEGRGYLQDFQNTDNIHRAISLFENAVNLDPDFALAFAGLGEAYWRLYDETRNTEWVVQAVEHARLAVEINDSHPVIHTSVGMIQRGTGNLEESIDSYQKALELDPDYANAYRGLALTYEQLGRVEKAEEAFKKAIQLQPTYWDGYNQLGAFYYAQHRLDEAIPQFEKVIELIPDSNFGYNNLAIVYYHLEDFEIAINMFQRAVEITPGPILYSNIATLYYYQSDFEKAAEMYENALSINDQDHRLWSNLASALYWAGEDSLKVAGLYEKAMNLALDELLVNPRNAEVLVSIAGYRASQGDSTEAENLLNDALEIAPENTFIKGNAGIVFENLGERNRALSLITDALEKGYSFIEINNDPRLKEFRNDPRYIQFLQEFSEDRQ